MRGRVLSLRVVVSVAIVMVFAFGFGGIAEAVSLAICTTDSQPGAIIQSARGAALSLAGTTVTYAPVATGITDGFVYIASDGKGGISPAVVIVTVAP